MNQQALFDELNRGRFRDSLRLLYGASDAILERQKKRYRDAICRFTQLFPRREEIRLFSAPGRTEIGGNHTDHQHGCALAAAVDPDVLAAASFHDEGVIRLYSEGYGHLEIDLSALAADPGETGKPSALVRGIAAGFSAMGVKIGGFDAYVTSDVLSGSGLSSSAAFETLIGTMIDAVYNESGAGSVEIAKIGQYAENVYFGKNSGLLDQTVCAVGGLVFLDFSDPGEPAIERIHADFAAAGFCLCVTDTKGSHSDLTADYAAVPAEMRQVARLFGKEYLREVDEEQFFNTFVSLRGKCSDRALLRAVHFFEENRRATGEAQALKSGDWERFFTLYRASAASSEQLLQNLYSCTRPLEQGIPLGIMMSRIFLGDKAAVRVHGGGFAGTIQAFVPLKQADEYAAKMDAFFGEGSCKAMTIRPVGGVEVKPQ